MPIKTNVYNISEEEKRNILTQHISASQNHYLPESTTKNYNPPFRSKNEGNGFREWINCYYPGIAAQFMFDTDGSFRNSTMFKVFNTKVNSPKTYKNNDNHVYSHIVMKYNLNFNEGEDVQLGRLYLADNIGSWSRDPFKCKKSKKK